MRRRSHDRHSDLSPQPTPLELVRAATCEYARAKHSRDAAVAFAKVSGTASLRQVADAAELSVSRIKQIAVGPVMGGATLPGVPEMDLLIDRAADDTDADDHDRVYALATVDPWHKRLGSERAFLNEDPRRLEGTRSNFAFELYDLDPTTRWTLVFVHSTHEVYALASSKPEHAEHDRMVRDPVEGSLSGPCVVLGHAFSYDILDAGLGDAVHNVIRRPGGLAWVYGRLRLVNKLLATTARGRTGITADPTVVWSYLESLSPSERAS